MNHDDIKWIKKKLDESIKIGRDTNTLLDVQNKKMCKEYAQPLKKQKSLLATSKHYIRILGHFFYTLLPFTQKEHTNDKKDKEIPIVTEKKKCDDISGKLSHLLEIATKQSEQIKETRNIMNKNDVDNNLTELRKLHKTLKKME